MDFKFDELIDFKLKPPFIPKEIDLLKKIPDENRLFQDCLNVKNKILLFNFLLVREN